MLDGEKKRDLPEEYAFRLFNQVDRHPAVIRGCDTIAMAW
jgi:hypothetical protein